MWRVILMLAEINSDDDFPKYSVIWCIQNRCEKEELGLIEFLIDLGDICLKTSITRYKITQVNDAIKQGYSPPAVSLAHTSPTEIPVNDRAAHLIWHPCILSHIYPTPTNSVFPIPKVFWYLVATFGLAQAIFQSPRYEKVRRDRDRHMYTLVCCIRLDGFSEYFKRVAMPSGLVRTSTIGRLYIQ